MASMAISAFQAGRDGDASALIFEYMAATQAETGRPVPAGVDDLPAPLQRECGNLGAVYRAPGVLLIAEHGGHPIGCVGLAVLSSEPERVAEVKRLYVRPAFRGGGTARDLMSRAHCHAASNGMTRLVLSVLPARTAVISFYRRLGYAETRPYETELPVRLVYMERPVTPPR
jgi:GNAT superfamily N-acetyltransferase